jgi:glucose/arabinose dehydrogenase/PKD repeat protein
MVLLWTLWGSPGEAVTVPPGFQDQLVFTGLTEPTAVRFAPNGNIFVAEKRGLIKLYDHLEDLVPTVFADLRTNVYDNWDRGLLGLAIHPNYPQEPYIYVLYTFDAPPGSNAPYYNDGCNDNVSTGCVTSARLSRLTSDGNTMVGGELVLLHDGCFQFPSHNIGDLAFGPDGALYVSVGDGASFNFVDYGQVVNPCADPPLEGGALRSQDLRTTNDPVCINGSILRINPTNGLALPGNPLFGNVDLNARRLVAYGLRNPFRFTLRPGTDEVWIGDVGWSRWEEINVATNPLGTAPVNFGWPCYEGANPQLGYQSFNLPICTNLYADGGAATDPFHAYSHEDPIAPGHTNTGSASITGLAFYPGGNYPEAYQDALFYADYARQCIAVMFPGANGLPDPTNRMAFAINTPRPVDLQAGPFGDLFYADIHAGEIRAIRYFSANPSGGPPPLNVVFDASASFDPDPDDTIEFAWDINGGGQFSHGVGPVITNLFFQPGYHNVRVRVTDNHGASTIKGILVVGGNSPPAPTIELPPATSVWAVGETIPFYGFGDDPEEGRLPTNACSWSIIMHHCSFQNPLDCHEHFLQSAPGVATGNFVAVDHEYPAHLEFRLTVTDSGSAWWDDQWTCRRRIGFNNEGRGEETNVIILVQLDASRINYALTRPGGLDLRFIDQDGTVLAHEIDRWDTNGISHVWVKVPHLAGQSNDDFIWMYYGNPAAPDGQNPAGVWSPDYLAVWHFNGDLQDASGHGRHAADFGSVNSTGRFGNARGFNGVNTYLEVPFDSELGFASNESFAVEAWVYVPGQPAWWEGIVGRVNAATLEPWYGIWVAPALNWAFGGREDNTVYSQVMVGGWQYVSICQNGSINKRTLYFNGFNFGSTFAQESGGDEPLYIGATIATPGEHFNGLIDEVRIARVARSDNWMEIQYRTMTDSLQSYGPEEVAAQSGLNATASRLLFPQIVTVELQSQPAGVNLTLGSHAVSAPTSLPLIVQSVNSLSAPAAITRLGTSLLFRAWSDGGARLHNFRATTTQTVLEAAYRVATDGQDRSDYEGNGASDPAVFNPATGAWGIRLGTGATLAPTFGWSETVPVPADYDGDGREDVAVFWPAGGIWYINQSAAGFRQRQFGWNATIPVPGDYDGDGQADLAVYWPDGGIWYVLRSTTGQLLQQQFGWSQSVPVPTDYDGDGRTDIAVYWPAAGNWYILRSTGGQLVQQFGWSQAAPVPADYDGDGRADLAVYWPTAGNWYIRRSLNGMLTRQFGWSASVPVPMDYDGDGRADLAVYWPAGATWYIQRSASNLITINLGNAQSPPAHNQYRLNKRWNLLP